MSGDPVLPDDVQTVPEALAFWPERTPDAPALRSIDGRAVSHQALAAAVVGVANRLAALGVQRDDRVALILPAGIDAWVTLLGTMVVAVAVPLNPEVSPAELARDLQRLPIRLVATDRAPDPVGRDLAMAPGLATITLGELGAPTTSRTISDTGTPSVDPDDMATILHTSGTTGFPKRVPRPHAMLVAGAVAIRATLIRWQCPAQLLEAPCPPERNPCFCFPTVGCVNSRAATSPTRRGGSVGARGLPLVNTVESPHGSVGVNGPGRWTKTPWIRPIRTSGCGSCLSALRGTSAVIDRSAQRPAR